MGEGGRRHLWGGRPGRRPKPEPAGRSPGAPQACTGARIARSTKPRAGQRAALGSARSYPPPAGRRSRSPCQAEAGEAASRAPPGSQTPCASDQAAEAGAFVVRHNYADPALPGQKFGAPHLPAPRPVPLAHPAPGCPLRGSDSRARDAQPAGLRCSTCLGGPAVSGAPEPGPAPPGRVRRDRVPTAPPPQRPTEQWGRGQAPLHPRGCQAPSGGRGWGAPPPPTPSESRGRSDGPGPDRRPGSPLSQARARSRRSLPFPSTVRPASQGAPWRRGEAGSCSPRSRPGPPPSRPLPHLPAVFAVAVPTAAPSSSPPRARAGAGASEELGTGSGDAGAGCAEEPGPPRRERRSRGRLGCGGGSGASLPARVRSLQLSSQRLTPGRGGYPCRRGAHWDFARPLPSFNPPVGPTGAFPRHSLTARRAAPRRRAGAAYFGSSLPASPTLLPPAPPPEAEPRPLRELASVAAILGRSPPGQVPGPGGRRPADAMTERSRSVKTPPPSRSRWSAGSEGPREVIGA